VATDVLLRKIEPKRLKSKIKKSRKRWMWKIAAYSNVLP
jgi:hypothetical protein